MCSPQDEIVGGVARRRPAGRVPRSSPSAPRQRPARSRLLPTASASAGTCRQSMRRPASPWNDLRARGGRERGVARSSTERRRSAGRADAQRARSRPAGRAVRRAEHPVVRLVEGLGERIPRRALRASPRRARPPPRRPGRRSASPACGCSEVARQAPSRANCARELARASSSEASSPARGRRLVERHLAGRRRRTSCSRRRGGRRPRSRRHWAARRSSAMPRSSAMRAAWSGPAPPNGTST